MGYMMLSDKGTFYRGHWNCTGTFLKMHGHVFSHTVSIIIKKKKTFLIKMPQACQKEWLWCQRYCQKFGWNYFLEK